MEINDLIGFGMTRTEARIYLELVKFEEVKIGELIKITNLHRGTVYNSLNSLVEKGFVSFIDKEDSRFYRISGKGIFGNLFQENNKQIEEKYKKIENFFNELATKNKNSSEQSVQVFNGIESFKSLYLEMFEDCKKKGIEYLFMGAGGKMADTVGMGYYKYTQELKNKKKIKCRILLSSESKNMDYHKHIQGEIKYLPTKVYSPINLWIYGNNILIVVWESKPLLCIKISSKEMADGFKNYFEGLWTISENEKSLFESRHKINIYDFMESAKESLDIFDICCMEFLHEGRHKVMSLLGSGKKVRVLIANLKSKNFIERVKLEEQFLKNINESRILYELKSSIANLRDIKARSQNSNNLEVRSYDNKSNSTIVIIDGKNVLYNKYSNIKGEYGSSRPTILIKNDKDNKFKNIKNIFESYWKSAKPVNLD